MRLSLRILGIVLALGFSPGVVRSAPTGWSAPEEAQLTQIQRFATQQHLQARSLSEMVQVLSQQFLGVAYGAGLLDQSPTEQLFVSLRQFDCVLFVETVLALARSVRGQTLTPDMLAQQIEVQRYRNGQMTDYCSRLHYFSDWIADNERRSLVQNLTADLGGVPLTQPLNFMTTHRSRYRQLQQDDVAFRCMEQVEARLAQEPRFYIPTPRIRSIYGQLQGGDIVAIATQVPGLDVTHTGFVERRGAAVGLIHASPAGAVTRAVDLQTYVGRVPDAIGIILARPRP